MSFLLKLGIKQNAMRMWVVMELTFSLCYQAEHLQDHHSERIKEESKQNIALFLSPLYGR